MSDSVNLYDILNVDNDATLKEIKSSYHKLSKEHHPDHGGDEEIFELIVHSYNILRNDETRAEYDSIMKLSKQSGKSWFDMKCETEKFYELQKNDKTEDELKLMNERFNLTNY